MNPCPLKGNLDRRIKTVCCYTKVDEDMHKNKAMNRDKKGEWSIAMEA